MLSDLWLYSSPFISFPLLLLHMAMSQKKVPFSPHHLHLSVWQIFFVPLSLSSLSLYVWQAFGKRVFSTTKHIKNVKKIKRVSGETKGWEAQMDRWQRSDAQGTRTDKRMEEIQEGGLYMGQMAGKQTQDEGELHGDWITNKWTNNLVAICKSEHLWMYSQRFQHGVSEGVSNRCEDE